MLIDGFTKSLEFKRVIFKKRVDKNRIEWNYTWFNSGVCLSLLFCSVIVF